MAKRKRTPPESRITRPPATAFARRVRTEGGDDDDDGTVKPPVETAAGSGPTKAPDPGAGPGTVGAVTTDAPTAPAPAAPAGSAPAVPAAATPAAPAAVAPAVVAPLAPGAAPAMPTPAPAAAPAMPTAAPAAAAEKLPLMPHPGQIPPGEPDDLADPPGLVPPGDSRSLRRGAEFVLVYRVANIVVSRFGPVGRRGQFRVVEYPTTAYAANAYARECSRWVSEGFSDYREP